jgi:predicted homoserine dehydrogenase-like protein
VNAASAYHTGPEETGMKIGFIGTGTMGQPMVANLV